MSLDVRACRACRGCMGVAQGGAQPWTGINDGIASSSNSSRLFFLNEIFMSPLQRALHGGLEGVKRVDKRTWAINLKKTRRGPERKHAALPVFSSLIF
jgi:hypothetical protein